jgi:hypothetical protein
MVDQETARLWAAGIAALPVQSGWMEAYKRGSHTVWDCKYHLVWGCRGFRFWRKADHIRPVGNESGFRGIAAVAASPKSCGACSRGRVAVGASAVPPFRFNDRKINLEEGLPTRVRRQRGSGD